MRNVKLLCLKTQRYTASFRGINNNSKKMPKQVNKQTKEQAIRFENEKKQI